MVESDALALPAIRCRYGHRCKYAQPRLEDDLGTDRVAQSQPRRSRLFVRERGRTIWVALDRVERLQAEQNYVRIVGPEGEYLHRSTLSALVAELDQEEFVRISRSTIVRVDAIRRRRPCGHGDCELMLESGARVRWSRLYRKRFSVRNIGS
jgi:DNA-binding LytR/AlgR family response regulator